jgi:hypothetical protein
MDLGHKNTSRAVVAAIVIAFALLCHAQVEKSVTARSTELSNAVKDSLAPDLPVIEVGPAIPLPVEGTPGQLWASAAPDDPERLLVCTFEADGAHARLTSAAYTSVDSGNTWIRTLLDTHSDWVSETSCAAGTRGRAYFVAGVSDTSRGPMRHERGSTEVYRSSDSGLSWTGPRRYPFIDWMRLGVRPTGSADTVYLFGNIQANGAGEQGGGSMKNDRRPKFVSADGLDFTAPEFPIDRLAEDNRGTFPVSVVVRSDATVLALYAEFPDTSFALYESDANGYRLLSRVQMPRGVTPYGALSAQMALDPGSRFRDRLYAAIPALDRNHPALVLAVSEDGGKSWRSSVVARETRELDREEIEYFYAGVAVNQDGVVGLEWLLGPGCPTFAISTDGGRSIAKSRRLGSCAETVNEKDVSPSVIRKRLKVFNDRSPVDHPMSDSLDAPPGFTIQVAAGVLGSVQIATDARGRFHVFWAEQRPDGVRTFTATISLAPLRLDVIRLQEAEELTERSLIRIEKEEFDPDTATFRIDTSVRNFDSAAMAYPSLLEVIADRSDCGRVEYLNPSAISEDGKPLFRVPRRPDRERLFPEESSLAVHIEVLVRGCEASRISLIETARKRAMEPRPFYPLAVRFHVYAAPRNPKSLTIRSGGLAGER